MIITVGAITEHNDPTAAAPAATAAASPTTSGVTEPPTPAASESAEAAPLANRQMTAKSRQVLAMAQAATHGGPGWAESWAGQAPDRGVESGRRGGELKCGSSSDNRHCHRTAGSTPGSAVKTLPWSLNGTRQRKVHAGAGARKRVPRRGVLVHLLASHRQESVAKGPVLVVDFSDQVLGPRRTAARSSPATVAHVVEGQLDLFGLSRS